MEHGTSQSIPHCAVETYGAPNNSMRNPENSLEYLEREVQKGRERMTEGEKQYLDTCLLLSNIYFHIYRENGVHFPCTWDMCVCVCASVCVCVCVFWGRDKLHPGVEWCICYCEQVVPKLKMQFLHIFMQV